jgi:KTSC domain
MERTLVNSSLIAEVGHRVTRTLEVRLTSGQTYRYADVPKTLFRRFLKSRSKGTFFNKYVRGKFAYREV